MRRVEVHAVNWGEDCYRVLPARIFDHSWKNSTGEPDCCFPRDPPPEFVTAMAALHDAFDQALAADWTPDQIVREARQVTGGFLPTVFRLGLDPARGEDG